MAIRRKPEAYAGSILGLLSMMASMPSAGPGPSPRRRRRASSSKSPARRARAGMGTAPAIWNAPTPTMVDACRAPGGPPSASPRASRASPEPLVRVTDAFVGESHAMRVDVSRRRPLRRSPRPAPPFRRCVGQSCAEVVAWVGTEIDAGRRAASGRQWLRVSFDGCGWFCDADWDHVSRGVMFLHTKSGANDYRQREGERIAVAAAGREP